MEIRLQLKNSSSLEQIKEQARLPKEAARSKLAQKDIRRPEKMAIVLSIETVVDTPLPCGTNSA